MNNKIIIDVLPKIVAYVAADLDKRFSLLEPFEINLNFEWPKIYDSKLLHMESSKLIIKLFMSTKDNAVCDGATLVPEEILDMPMVIGALVHDPLYWELELWAKAMGYTGSEARKIADTIYANLLWQIANRQSSMGKKVIGKAWAHLNYSGVRLLGGIAHKIYKVRGLMVLVLAVSSLLLIEGCMSDMVIDDWQEPDYQEEQVSDENYTEIWAYWYA